MKHAQPCFVLEHLFPSAVMPSCSHSICQMIHFNLTTKVNKNKPLHYFSLSLLLILYSSHSFLILVLRYIAKIALILRVYTYTGFATFVPRKSTRNINASPSIIYSLIIINYCYAMLIEWWASWAYS